MMFFQEVHDTLPPLRIGILGIGEAGLEAVHTAMPQAPDPVEMTYGHVAAKSGEAACTVVEVLALSGDGRTGIGLAVEPARPLESFWEGIDLAMTVFDRREPGALPAALRAAAAARAASAFPLAVCAGADPAWIACGSTGYQAMVRDFNRLGIAPILACADADGKGLPGPARPLEIIPRMVAGDGLICVDIFDVRCAMDRWQGVTLMGVERSANCGDAAVQTAMRQAFQQARAWSGGAAASGVLVEVLAAPDAPMQALNAISDVVGHRVTGPEPVVLGWNIDAGMENELQVALFLCGVAVPADQGA